MQLWPAGAATGAGSMPGTDAREAVRVVFGELPDLPFLPELPARGPGADMIGRGAALLVDLPVELYAGRWRITARPGRDLRLARELLERDLDALHDEAAEYAGTLKLQAAGPWTLAADLELPRGGRVLRDPGAAKDLTVSLAEGLRQHLDQVRARLPRSRLLLQLDEPELPAVLAGRVPTDSGLYTWRAVEAPVARGALADVGAAVDAPLIVHCCASDVPVALLREAGVAAIGLDVDRLTALDPLGEAIDAGIGLVAGVADPLEPAPPSAVLADKVRELFGKLGFPPATAARQVAVSPNCGLAGTTPANARALLSACVEAGRRLRDDE